MKDISGDQEAVEQLVRTEYVRLVRAVALSCGSTPTAEDAVQEAFARLWARVGGGELFDHPTGWVVTVALNLTRSRWRRERREVSLAERHESTVELDTALLDLAVAVDALPRRQREVVVLHYYLGYEVRLIADVLDVSEGNIKNALHRARHTLASALRIDEEVADRD